MSNYEEKFEEKLKEAEKLSSVLKSLTDYEPRDAELSAVGFDATIDLAKKTQENFDKMRDDALVDADVKKVAENDLKDVIDLLKEKVRLIKGNVEEQYGQDSDEYRSVKDVNL